MNDEITYKDTLNLPTTNFAMKANLTKCEPLTLANWQDSNLYNQIRDSRINAKKFVLHDGPPYANGHLHCGHALNKILKDIIIKSKTLNGYDAAFVPGWDCHGLPIELNVEKKIGKAGHKVSINEFRTQCRHYTAQQIDIQRAEFQRLGVFGEWDNPYTTYDSIYEANVMRALGRIINNGHLERGVKPVHWCIECGSALAEAEVDYENKVSDAIDVAFLLQHSEAWLQKHHVRLQPVIVPIWTTTPWTLLANEAVCVHPEIKYLLLDCRQKYFIVAADLAVDVMQRYESAHYTIAGEFLGTELAGLLLLHPLTTAIANFNKIVPIILGTHVTTEVGTGCVHTAPMHGPDDYKVGMEYNLPLVNYVLMNGCYAPDVPHFASISVLKVDAQIIALLESATTLLYKTTIEHSYPHCWRHKKPMIFLATPQWFIAMDKSGLRQAMQDAVQSIQWLPEWGSERMSIMIKTKPDWCISRQRAWGTPMPLLIHKITGDLHPDTVNLINKIADLVAEHGVEAWLNLSVTDFLLTNADDYIKSTDTLDVWFDAGVSHFAVPKQHPQVTIPADVYFEGADQYRGWFNSSLTTAVAIYNHAPYKAVLTHGYTVDADGRKLSKSKGNYVALDKLINQYGADILRLWVASVDYTYEVSISDEIIRRNVDAYRRIRNTARFLLANLFDFQPDEHIVAIAQMIELDQWIIKRCQLLQEEIINAYEQYNFHLIYQKIHNFCVLDLSSFYLDVIKDRQYTNHASSINRRSCQTAIYYIINALTLWLAPILSFTVDEIWQYIPGRQGSSIFLELWYTSWPVISNVDMPKWQILQNLRDAVNRSLEIQRKVGNIGSGLEADVHLYIQNNLHFLKTIGDELRFIFITSAVYLHDYSEIPANAIINDDLGCAIAINANHHSKCNRCWHRCADIGNDMQHPTLCNRCVKNINNHTEIRQYA